VIINSTTIRTNERGEERIEVQVNRAGGSRSGFVEA
jgi:hypothetical protein